MLYSVLMEQRNPGLLWFSAGVVVLASLAEYRVVIGLHRSHFNQLLNVTWGVTIGETGWMEHQARLLGPWLVRCVAGKDPKSFADVFVGAHLAFTAAKNLLCFDLARRLSGDSRAALRAALAGSLLFLLIQDWNWLFLWDYLDIIFFSLFVYGVVARRGILFFALLFVPAVLNRESALFMALWLVLDAFALRENGRWVAPRLHDRARLALGTALLAGGASFIFAARRILLVKELGPELNPAIAAERPFHLGFNLHGLAAAWSSNWHVALLPFLSLPLAAAALILFLRRMDDLQAKQALLVLAVLASIVLVGFVAETRIYSMLIPFAVLLPLYRPSPSQGERLPAP